MLVATLTNNTLAKWPTAISDTLALGLISEGIALVPIVRPAALQRRPGRQIEHALQLSTLTEAGLTDSASLAAAGWEPALLDAIDRATGWAGIRSTQS